MISRYRDWIICGFLLLILVGVGLLKGLPRSNDKTHSVPLTDTSDFVEIQGNFQRPYFLVDVLVGGHHIRSFVLDSGWAHGSVLSRSVANELGIRGNATHCQLLLKNGTKLDFVAQVSDQVSTVNSQRSDGTIGLGLLSKLQLLLDYQNGQVWCRNTKRPLSYDEAALALASALEPAGIPHITETSMRQISSGAYTVPVQIGTSRCEGTVDTGATALYVDPKRVKRWGLPKLVDIDINTPFGNESGGVFMASTLRIAGYSHLWPVIRTSLNEPETGVTVGASYLPSQLLVLDFPGRKLYFKPPIQANLVNQAIREYFNRYIGLFNNKLRMDWPIPSDRYPSLEFSIIRQVQGIPASDWTRQMVDFSNGDLRPLSSLERVYIQTFSHEDLVVQYEGKDRHFPAEFP